MWFYKKLQNASQKSNFSYENSKYYRSKTHSPSYMFYDFYKRVNSYMAPYFVTSFLYGPLFFVNSNVAPYFQVNVITALLNFKFKTFKKHYFHLTPLSLSTSSLSTTHPSLSLQFTSLSFQLTSL